MSQYLRIIKSFENIFEPLDVILNLKINKLFLTRNKSGKKKLFIKLISTCNYVHRSNQTGSINFKKLLTHKKIVRIKFLEDSSFDTFKQMR